MNRTAGTGILCQSVLYSNPIKRIRSDYKKQIAKDLSLSRLKARLCEEGPMKCAECMLCEYGKEYARRAAR